MPRFTKKQVEQQFRQEVLPVIREIEAENGNGVDDVMRREEWCNYTDMLRADGQISAYQDRTWSNPF